MSEANYCKRVLLVVVVAGMVWVGQAQAQTYTEDFESGYTLGQNIGTHPNWYDGGNGPTVSSGIGLESSVGLTEASAIFNWVAHPFSWNDVSKVIVGMDFQTAANSGHFDDDRCGWTINSGSVDSGNFFGAQLNHPDGGIVTYWRDSNGSRVQTQIVALPDFQASTWYRFRNEITRLTATSARIDVSLYELDASGNPTGTPWTGSVEDTSAWPDGAPDTKYFTAATIWPAYKNYSVLVGAADNAYFEIVPAGPVPTVTLVSPEDDSLVRTTSVSFTCSASDEEGLQEATLYIDGLPQETLSMSGTSDTVIFGPITLADEQDYVWNCLVTNVSSGQSWAPADFHLTVNTQYPNEPSLVAPEDGATDVSIPATLVVTVSDPQGGLLDVTFYGKGGASGGDSFTIIALPDTQYYSESYPDVFTSQTQWIVDNASSRNIVFVTHEGDIVQTWNNTTQWARADASMSLLDDVVPYGVLPGNHDMDTSTRRAPLYNSTFPSTRYAGEPWYGGHYDSDPDWDNNNNYQLFSAGGMDFIVLHLEYDPRSEVIAWADGVLTTYAGRIGIITTHSYLNTDGSRTTPGNNIWNGLVLPNDNVYLVLCGHMHGEARRTDLVNGRQVHQILADYQERANGGNGWLRIMRFVPAEDTVYVETYSPWLSQYETDNNSQFTLDVPMNWFAEIGTDNGVASGSNASVNWTDLQPGTGYEWFVEVSDGTYARAGPTWSFITGGNQPPVADAGPDQTVTDSDENGVEMVTLDGSDSSDPDGTIAAYEWKESGTVLGTAAIITCEFSVGTHAVTLTVTDNEGATDTDDVVITVNPGHVDNVASSDIPVKGTIVGSYLDTQQTNDGQYEEITEVVSGGGQPKNLRSSLEHKWTFNVTGGNVVTFYVEAHHTANSEGDDFVFAYSTDNSTYTDMLTVTKTSDDDTYHTYSLPSSISGTVYIRVQDADQTRGNGALDTIYVDHMFIRSSVVVTPPDPATNPDPQHEATDVAVDVDLSWTAGAGAESHDVYFGTSESPAFAGNQAGTTFEPGTLDNDTTYYWRIDEKNSYGTTPGPIWSFTTQPAGSVVHVESIEMSYGQAGVNYYGLATVWILDDNAANVEGATVYGDWSNAVSGTSTGVTASDGKVTLRSPKTKNAGTFTFTVTGVAVPGYTYDPDLNVETTDSITTP